MKGAVKEKRKDRDRQPKEAMPALFTDSQINNTWQTF